MTIDVS